MTPATAEIPVFIDDKDLSQLQAISETLAGEADTDTLRDAKLKRFAAAQSEDSAAENSNKEESEMWKDLKSAEFNFGTSGKSGNPMGGRWARHIKTDAAAKNEYDQLKGYKDKAQFRAAWAKTKYETFEAAKSFTEAFTREEVSSGKYLA